MSYIVQPKKEPRLMNEEEFLEWELSELHERRRRCKDPYYYPGFDGRIAEINEILAQKKKDKKLIKESPIVPEISQPVEIPTPFNDELAKEQVKSSKKKKKKEAQQEVHEEQPEDQPSDMNSLFTEPSFDE